MKPHTKYKNCVTAPQIDLLYVQLNGNRKKRKRMPVNTPTKIGSYCSGKSNNNAVACDRVLWELNNLSVLQVNE